MSTTDVAERIMALHNACFIDDEFSGYARNDELFPIKFRGRAASLHFEQQQPIGSNKHINNDLIITHDEKFIVTLKVAKGISFDNIPASDSIALIRSISDFVANYVSERNYVTTTGLIEAYAKRFSETANRTLKDTQVEFLKHIALITSEESWKPSPNIVLKSKLVFNREQEDIFQLNKK